MSDEGSNDGAGQRDERSEGESGERDEDIGRAERRLQSKLEAGTISEAEYARLTAIRFGRDPAEFSFADAARLYDLSEDELRAEMAWLSEESGSGETSDSS